MEPAQKQRIQDNLPQIIQDIKFTKPFMTYFEQHRVLAECDIESIEAKNTNSEKVYELLDTLKSRSNGFAVLVFALRETLQDAVANILDPGKAYVPTPVVLPPPPIVHIPVVAQNLPPPVQLDYVVGNEGCEIHTILTVIKDNPVGHTFQSKWGDFALRLGVPASDRNKYKTMVNKGDAELIDVVEYCIDIWRSKNGANAKLSSLLKVIEECNSKEIAGRCISDCLIVNKKIHVFPFNDIPHGLMGYFVDAIRKKIGIQL